MIRQAGQEVLDALRHPGENLGHVAHVAVHDRHAGVAVGQQRVQTPDDDRVAVDVRHPRVGVDLLLHWRWWWSPRHPAANVDELADPLVRGPGHRAGKEVLVLHGAPQQIGKGLDQPISQIPVGGEIVLAADEVVVDPRDGRSIRVKVGHAPHSNHRRPLSYRLPDRSIGISAGWRKTPTAARALVPRRLRQPVQATDGVRGFRMNPMPSASVCQGEWCRSWVVTGADGGDSRYPRALSVQAADDGVKLPIHGLPDTGLRVTQQRMYRARLDHAYAMARGPTAQDGWAEAVPKLLASWRILKEKYGHEERPEPAPQADGGSWRGKGGRAPDAARNAEIDLGYARIREVGENVIAPAILRVRPKTRPGPCPALTAGSKAKTG